MNDRERQEIAEDTIHLLEKRQAELDLQINELIEARSQCAVRHAILSERIKNNDYRLEG